MSAVADQFSHEPVMVDEITGLFATVPPGVVLDATLGGGGHSAALLAARPDLSVLGIDRDRSALAAAGARLGAFSNRVLTYHGRFDELEAGLAQHGVEHLSGALFDLGVSSHQLDVAERGFSYRHDGPLDMRMDRDGARSADDIVNGMEPRELGEIIWRYGDERFARRIAAAIVAARPIATTQQLAATVVSAIPAPARRTGGHPAKRTFQALRIAVNGELDAIPTALDAAIDKLVVGGRIAVLAYHSGEHRLVKQRLRFAATAGCECPPQLPCVCGAVPTVRRVRAPKQPSLAEQRRNRRATSARLRVAEKI